MTTFSTHLGALTTSKEESTSKDRAAVDEWSRHVTGVKSTGINEQGEPEFISDDEDGWSSVLDIYKVGHLSGRAHSELLSKVLMNSQREHILDELHSVLRSHKPNDTISEDLAELIGFEDIELVMQILDSRPSFTSELGEYLLHRDALQAQFSESGSLEPRAARRRMEEKLRENASRPLTSGVMENLPEVLPHVYTSSLAAQGNVLSHLGTNYELPIGHTREDNEDYEEITLPPAKAMPPRASERLVSVNELDPLAKGSFPGYTSLNRIQSIIYPVAYRSNENMLVCAPTGAGKTDVAMLTVLRVLDQHREPSSDSKPLRDTIHRDAFKIIYVAPMKALASEIVRKLGKRLRWLSIQVKELTGDMQLTKAEIAETQIIVTTPEKWDVVTRKPTGEGELVARVKLLILDEVHLLNDERGAVIEAIVARTLRQVETTQSVIRVVGLSATLPNYVDVADFLGVNRRSGLFYFDSSFRPIPLEQHFIGVKGKQLHDFRRNLDRVTFEKVSELVKEGHQVMVFVHSRKDTVNTAMNLKEAALADGLSDDFSCEDHPSFYQFQRDLSSSRNKQMKELFNYGFGIHHAGMLREDRNKMERMFDARAIKVLCCTATLAWGVNLPAHAVIIKGTQVYDSARGAVTDLSILDVLQVFGRAGRPGLETSGIGFICTPHDKLDYYCRAVMSQIPIESKFDKRTADALNAEISLGTVANIHDAVQWLRYTYLFVRMSKNPLYYGLSRDELSSDPRLSNKLEGTIRATARQLARARMVTCHSDPERYIITDIGRIAAKFYISYQSIEIFNEHLKEHMSEADMLNVLSKSTEFNQIQLRENEDTELKFLESEFTVCEVPGHTDTTQGKVNILLQAYISRTRPEDFALVSDQSYVAQNAGRIVRALLEIAITKKWANTSAALMEMSKAIEKRLWPTKHPLMQFPLKQEVIYNLERFADEYEISELAAMTPMDLGKLVHMNEIHGGAIRDAAKQFPTVRITYRLRPLGHDVLKISVRVARDFNWSTKIHGSVEPFWLWVQDDESATILQLFHLVFRQSTDALDVDFVISMPTGKARQSVTICFVSDRWLLAKEEVTIPFDTLVMPAEVDSHTPRLNIPFLPLSILGDPRLEDIFGGIIHGRLNAIQSQVYWSLVNTRTHALLCAPSSCGKSFIGQIVVWRTVENAKAGNWVLIISPRRAMMNRLLEDLRPVSGVMHVQVDRVTRDSTFESPKGRAIRVVLSSDLPFVLRCWQRSGTRFPPGLRLVVCENLELLDPPYEISVSLLLRITQTQPTRYLGLSTSLNDPTDLAAWLNVDPSGLHSFRQDDREQSLLDSTQSFTIPQSAALFKAMAKPANDAIRDGADGQAIVFVPSRGLCSTLALDLLTQRALESGTYLPSEVTPNQLEAYLVRSQDATLVDALSRGVGFFHEGLSKQDQNLVLEMYTEQIIRVLIVPRDALWSLSLRAGVVIVMGTQYFHITPGGEQRQLRDYGWEELVHMQGRAVRHNAMGHFRIFCQAEGKDTILRFLKGGLPLESRLLETSALEDWYREQKEGGFIRNEQDALDALSYTFLARRLESNPNYYDAPQGSKEEILSRIVDRSFSTTSV